jgi:transcriptional regulator NrdR family protein
MDCPRCHSPTAVLEKRDGDRRRRECSSQACQFRFTTYEIVGSELEHLREAKHKLEQMQEILSAQDSGDTLPAALDVPL